MMNQTQLQSGDDSRSPMTSRWGWLNWPARARRAAMVSYWLLLTWSLLAPSRDFQHLHYFSFQDKIAHLALFAVLAALVSWSSPQGWGRGWRRIAVIASMIAYGVATEFIQPLVPDAERAFEWFDIAMDCAGISAGLWLCGLAASRVNRPSVPCAPS